MESSNKNIILITCTSNKNLSESVSKFLNVPLTDNIIDSFSNTETRVTIPTSVRKKNVFIIQTGEGNTNKTVNEHLMETLITIDACKRGSAKSINVILALYPYSRQDKKDRSRAPITASLVANLLTSAGATRVMSVELHADQIQGMFQIPVDNIFIEKEMIDLIHTKIINVCRNDSCKDKINVDQLVIVSPDAGGAKRAERFSKNIQCNLALMYKERDYTTKNKVSKTVLLGDVKDKIAIIVDDMADTCGTLISACDTLKDNGAKEVYAIVTHGIFSGPAIQRINESKSINSVFASNSLDQTENCNSSNKIKYFDIGEIIAESIRRVIKGQSLSELYLPN